MNTNDCEYCQRKIPERRNKQARYCSHHCQKEHYKAKHPWATGTASNRSATGAMSEMLVCADLLKRGFSVFRSVSPSCSCDIVYLDNGKLVRVEVKTAYRYHTGNVMFALHKDQRDKHDLLALVFHTDNSIEYRPPFQS